ncbi:MAG: hypothetical protein Q8K23_11805 [Sulfuritalea sp.]|nr:hypothetical protein [Sulfuritalea sp.]
MTESITVDQWVGELSAAAHALFENGRFEEAMLVLKDAIADARRNRQSIKGASFMIPGDDQLDIALPEKIMRAVAEHLYSFTPSEGNLYRAVLAALPDGSCIFTLNYDSLLELVAAEQRVNLLEHNLVRKPYLSHPTKSVTYVQLHGGVTLCSMWSHFRPRIPGLISHSEVERISRRVYISKDLRFDLNAEDYNDNLRDLAALSFYNPEKSNVIAPGVFDSFHKFYSELVTTNLTKLIVVGCNYTAHDRHIWEAVEQFAGDIYWCGTVPEQHSFSKPVINVGPLFSSSVDEILRRIEG